MNCRLFGAMRLHGQMLTCCQLNHSKHISVWLVPNYNNVGEFLPQCVKCIYELQILVMANGTTWQWVDNSESGQVPRNAVVGAYSPEGRPVYVVFAKEALGNYFAGNYQEGNYHAEYIKVNGWELRSTHTWQYLVIVSGEFAILDGAVR